MKLTILSATLVLMVLPIASAQAAGCVSGPYRTGCAGPNGAAVVRHPPTNVTRCASGPNRAGCVGPRGAVGVGPNGAAAARRY